MNYDEMILAHDRWKIRLKTLISQKERINAEPMSRDDQCDLGKWIYGDGKRFAAMEAFKDLVDKHAKFHKTIGNVVRQAQTLPPDQAMELLHPLKSEFGRTSAACINAIAGLKKLLG
jgi:hypothetical protein